MKGLKVAEQEDTFVVKKIVDERIVEGSYVYRYRVEWQSYQGQDTWEPYNNMKGRGDDAIAEFKDSRGLPWVSGGGACGRGRGVVRVVVVDAQRHQHKNLHKSRRRNEEEEE